MGRNSDFVCWYTVIVVGEEVGANNASAQSLLKQDYKEDCDLKEACGMAVKVLSKTMDSTKLSSEKSKLGCGVCRYGAC